ncbi:MULTISPECIES: hypothetical protein [Niastella]|uniref:Uncharacterized protein n=1 Tax=Niastella soli TaxID=2821487 RepID=A0ABS3Z5I5_9BACT|nr:hypothetical protein [Niastella soli]MBO9205411.1 hypothetical protein [Niastella soli]
MRRTLLIIIILQASFLQLTAQVNGSFIVNGDLDKFYPVSFYDGGWDSSAATEVAIGRSSVHTNSSWRGSVIASFRYHCTNWGHESKFIDADIKQFNQLNSTTPNTFVAGWQDASGSSTVRTIVIWLRGGGTTYYYHANYAVSPAVYDNNQNSLPYAPTGWSFTYKTAIDDYVNSRGLYYENTAFLNGEGINYFKGSVGIGTVNPQAKLAVNGDIYSKKVKVTQTGWPDYVFHTTYRLRPLSEVEQFIKLHHHLPEVPSAADVKKDALDVGDNQATLLKKIEELTLYIISLNKEVEGLKRKISQLQVAK